MSRVEPWRWRSPFAQRWRVRSALNLMRWVWRPSARPPPDGRFSLDLVAEIGHAVERGGQRATFRLSGPVDPAALENWNVAGIAAAWSRRGFQTVLALDEGAVDCLDGAQRLHLRDLISGWHVNLEQGSALPVEN